MIFPHCDLYILKENSSFILQQKVVGLIAKDEKSLRLRVASIFNNSLFSAINDSIYGKCLLVDGRPTPPLHSFISSSTSKAVVVVLCIASVANFENLLRVAVENLNKFHTLPWQIQVQKRYSWQHCM